MQLERMKNMPTFNCLRVVNEMKKVWNNSDESEGGFVRNKLLYLFIDAEKFLGNQLSPRSEERDANSFPPPVLLSHRS